MKKLALFLAFASFLLASIGQITGLEGKVEVIRSDGSKPATLGFLLENRDLIKTSNNAKVQLVMNDDTVITLGKNSQFAIDEVDFASRDPKAKFSAKNGTFKVMTGKIAKIAPKNFELKGRTSTIGIRGTHFVGSVTDSGDTIACTDGAIIVTSTATGERVTVNAGQMTQVGQNSSPSTPSNYTAGELEDLSGGNGGETEQETEQETKQTEQKQDDGKKTEIITEVLQEVNQDRRSTFAVKFASYYSSSDETQNMWSDYPNYINLKSFDFDNSTNFAKWGKTEVEYKEFSENNTFFEKISMTNYWVHPTSGFSLLTGSLPTMDFKRFSGRVAGGVFDAATFADRGEIISSSSNMTLILDDASNDITFTANISFQTTKGDNWNITYNGLVDGNGVANGSSNNGYLEGSFVVGSFVAGSTQDVVGAIGEFEATKGNDVAVGVYLLGRDDLW